MSRFVFLTGITKFSQVSIFSELNNITNVSMDDEYAGICSITKEELLTQMSEDIDMLAEAQGLSREETIAKLKENYDGYHFSPAKIGRSLARASAFDAPTENLKTITPLLYQSGYITIKGYDKMSQLFTLDLPNKEIKVDLFESLLPNYLEGMYTEEGDIKDWTIE